MSLTESFRQFALLFRVPNSFTVLSNGITAYLLAVNAQSIQSDLIILLTASLCFYHAGIVLNDCVDVEEDRRNQAHRPLPSGAIKPGLAWGMVAAMLLVGLLLLLPFGRNTLMWGGALVALILAYNFSPRSGLIGCVFMGMCRGANYLVVFSAMGSESSLWPIALLVSVYVMSLTFLSRDEEYASRPWLAYLSLFMLSIAGGVFISLSILKGEANYLAVAFALTMLAYALIKIILLLRDYRPEKIRGMVKFFILGMIPLDACLLLVAGFTLPALCILLLILPSRYLAKFLYVT